MDDICQTILALDNSLKLLSTHYDNKTSNQLKTLNEQINAFEKRRLQLIDNLEQCSARVNIIFRSESNLVLFSFKLKKSNLNFATSVQTNVKPGSDTVEKTITTVVEETTIKKRKIDNDNTLKYSFDLSARKFLDWIDIIEKILADKQGNNSKPNERQETIQEIKLKYLTYDEQFKELMQQGNTITKELKEGKLFSF